MRRGRRGGAIWHDLRHAANRLAKTPMLAAVASLTLGLGVAANSAIFSVLDAMFFRPLPVADSDRLARVYTGTLESPRDRSSYPDFVDYRDNVSSFSELLTSGRRGALLREGDATEMLIVEVVSRNYFDVLQVTPEAGRSWLPDAADSADDQLVMISHDLWQRRFGERPDIAGKPIHLSGQNLVIGGVLPRKFRGLDRLIAVDAWISFETWSSQLNNASDFKRRGFRWLEIWGRLAQDRTVDQAGAECSVVTSRLAREYPETNKDRISSVVLDVAERRRQGFGLAALLMSLAGLVLLVCCGNIANLLLAQSEGRRREMATRSALGASRLRIAGQVIVESLLLAALGGACGLLLAWWLISLLPSAMPQTAVRLNLDFALDARVSAFTCFVAMLATVLCGAAPALHTARVDLMSVLRGGSIVSGASSSKLNVRSLLVVAQVAACVALLTASGLLIRSLFETARIHPGFERKSMLLMDLNPGLAGYSRAESVTFSNDLAARLGSLPGVDRASYAMRAPLSPSGGGASVKVAFPSRDVGAQESEVAIKYNSVEPDYFATMGTRIQRGRAFEPLDREASRPVVLISQTMAQRFWGAAEPIGDVIRIAEDTWEIVGVVEDVKINRIHEPPEPYLYFPFAQRPRSEVTFLIETAAEPDSLAEPIRRVLRGLAPGVPILQLSTQEELMRYALYGERVFARLASALGILGLFLAATGLFGVISYLVRRRTNEIGIRLALGAQQRDVLTPFVKTGLVLGFIGVVMGSSVCLVVADLFSDFLYGISAKDPLSFLGAAGVVIVTMAFASFLPARAAARVDPIRALRHE